MKLLALTKSDKDIPCLNAATSYVARFQRPSGIHSFGGGPLGPSISNEKVVLTECRSVIINRVFGH